MGSVDLENDALSKLPMPMIYDTTTLSYTTTNRHYDKINDSFHVYQTSPHRSSVLAFAVEYATLDCS